MKRVVYLPAAAKALRRHKADAERIVAKIAAYAENPAAQANNIKALQGTAELRLRIGDYRAIFVERQDEIVVTRIGPRGAVYD